MPFPRLMIRYSRLADRAARRFAGHGSLAELQHVGRVSGLPRRTPVRAFRVPGDPHDTVVIGVNFGRRCDWLRNLEVAGGGRILLRGRLLDLGAPHVVPLAEGAQGLPGWFALGLRVVARTEHLAVLPVLADAPVGGSRR